MGEPVNVLIIDNEPRRLLDLEDLAESVAGLSVTVVEPQHASAAQIESADLISVDHYLGDIWDAVLDSVENPIPAATQARNGIALAAALDSRDSKSESVKAITLHTADLDELGYDLPRDFREPLVAAQHGLDWVFRFDESNRMGFATQVAGFAADWAKARESLTNGVEDFGAELLLLPASEAWSRSALQQISNARPPVQTEARYTHGRSYFRWLSQRVLPFPSFLFSDQHVSNLLGISLSSLDILANSDSSKLEAYSGPLSSLFPRRWWVASAQQTLSDAGVDETDSAKDRADALSAAVEVKLTGLKTEFPSVVVDRDGSVVSIDVEREETARISIDGWPSFAEEARVSIADAATDATLFAYLPPSERRRVSNSGLSE